MCSSGQGGGKAAGEAPSSPWKLLRTGLKVALGLGCALAAAPSILSLPPVTRAACGLASSMLPGQVQVQTRCGPLGG